MRMVSRSKMFQILCAVVMVSMASPSWVFAQAFDMEEIGMALSDSVRAANGGLDFFPGSTDAATQCCPVDVNGDCNTNGADLSVLLSRYGQAVDPGNPADLNGDDQVNGADLSVLLSAYGCLGSPEEPAPPVCP
jgi:hypothetical protein